MTVIEIAKSKLKNIYIPDEEIQIALDEVEQVILNYCNIYVVPEELFYTWANMAVDLIRFQFVRSGGDLEGDKTVDGVPSGMNIISVSVGDTTTKFEESSGVGAMALSSHVRLLDTLVLDYGSQLQKFRLHRF